MKKKLRFLLYIFVITLTMFYCGNVSAEEYYVNDLSHSTNGSIYSIYFSQASEINSDYWFYKYWNNMKSSLKSKFNNNFLEFKNYVKKISLKKIIDLSHQYDDFNEKNMNVPLNQYTSFNGKKSSQDLSSDEYLQLENAEPIHSIDGVLNSSKWEFFDYSAACIYVDESLALSGEESKDLSDESAIKVFVSAYSFDQNSSEIVFPSATRQYNYLINDTKCWYNSANCSKINILNSNLKYNPYYLACPISITTRNNHSELSFDQTSSKNEYRLVAALPTGQRFYTNYSKNADSSGRCVYYASGDDKVSFGYLSKKITSYESIIPHLEFWYIFDSDTDGQPKYDETYEQYDKGSFILTLALGSNDCANPYLSFILDDLDGRDSYMNTYKIHENADDDSFGIYVFNQQLDKMEYNKTHGIEYHYKRPFNMITNLANKAKNSCQTYLSCLKEEKCDISNYLKIKNGDYNKNKFDDNEQKILNYLSLYDDFDNIINKSLDSSFKSVGDLYNYVYGDEVDNSVINSTVSTIDDANQCYSEITNYDIKKVEEIAEEYHCDDPLNPSYSVDMCKEAEELAQDVIKSDYLDNKEEVIKKFVSMGLDPYDILLTCDSLGTLLDWLKILFNIIKFGTPVLVIFLSVIDFIRAMTSGEEDANKKAFNKLIKRCLIGLAIVLLPYILEFILNTFNVFEDLKDPLCGIR